MSGKAGSSLGTLLFSVPLAAIPLMAIFGIPQFAPVSASPDHRDGFDRARDEYPDVRLAHEEPLREYDYERERGRLPLDESQMDGRRPRHEFYETDSYDRRSADRERRPSGMAYALTAEADSRDSAPSDALASDSLSHAPETDLRRDLSRLQPPVQSAAPQAPGLTWQDAARQLHELGIQNYHLEPGTTPEAFLFVCTFCPEQHPNVTMRFEAESAEPICAVQDVLSQIEHWKQQQVAAPQTAAP